MTRIAIRPHSAETASLLAGHGIHPILARILAARGVARPSELSTELTDLLPPTQLKGIDDAARYLADAIAAGKRLLIVADYDCDGATACAVGVRGLRMLGAQVGYIVPNRFEYGYGLSPEIVALAARERPDVLVTVDNGIADVVRLDANNRLLVAQGLKRMRAGRMCAGIAALFRVAGREARRASTFDLGFGLGPRLNAAGRLADMSLGIECLLTDDFDRAMAIAAELDGMNRERREIEAGMQQEAMAILASTLASMDGAGRHTIAVYNETWHQGVIGIVASRLKDKFHRPVITFAPGDDGVIKGSGRSIPGFHLRDALDAVHKRCPGLIVKFGGHAMAAGLSLHADGFDRFVETFEAVGREWLDESLLSRVLETDGEAEAECFTPQFVELLETHVWGQGFPAPSFCGEFDVLSQAVLKDKHLKLQLGRGKQRFDAIWFNHAEPLGASAYVAYRLDNNTFNGITRVQMVIEHAQ